MPAKRPHRPSLGLTAAAVVLAVAAVIAILYWPRTPVSAPVVAPVSPPTSDVAPTPAAHPAPASSTTEATTATETTTPVRFRNPFDSSEVFEFPAGTPYGEARDQVAERLLARARQRIREVPSAPKTTATAGAESSAEQASLARQL
jgi:hypothetical protein